MAHFRVQSIRSQQKLGLLPRQRAAMRRDEARQAAVGCSDLTF